MVANNPHMLWKRLAPFVLAVTVTAVVSAAASLASPVRDWEPKWPTKIAMRAL
jgi:hypothetical protein